MAGDWLGQHWTVMLVGETTTPILVGLYRKHARAKDAAAQWNAAHLLDPGPARVATVRAITPPARPITSPAATHRPR